MTIKDLTEDDYNLIKLTYKKSKSKKKAQKKLSKYFNVVPRTIRKWAKRMDLNVQTFKGSSKIMVYDIETSRGVFKAFWTGKQFLSHKQMIKEPKIISISWKWIGQDKVHHLTWDKNQCDKQMVKEFLVEYNKADMLIGQNNDNFDNRWVQARAMKFGLDFNTYIRSFDIMKQNKRLFRVVSYSLDYVTKFIDVTFKQSHEGIKMWDMIEDGTPEQQSEYLQKMIDYNVGDIISTEDIYLKNRKYYGHKTHFGVLNGEEKYTCPNCGSNHVKLYKTTVTPAGTIQRIMKCDIDDVKYKITNKQYMLLLENRMITKV